MRRRFGQELRIGIGPGGIAVVQTSRWQRTASIVAECAFAAVEPGSVAQPLRELFEDAAPAGWPVTIVLSDELVRMWQVAPPPAASRMADLEAAAALRFQSLFGTSAAEWKIAADWDVRRPFLAAAVPVPLLSQCEQAARELKFHLVEIVPQFVAAMNRWRKLRRPAVWFGLVHEGVLTIAAFDGPALAAVRAVPVTAGADGDWLQRHVAREALRLGIACPGRLQLAGPVPAAWSAGEGRSQLDCSVFDDGLPAGWSALARLAATGA
jgi:hypothetical protein